jgi:glycosyltransferase involved in cell wall biosynthesis
VFNAESFLYKSWKSLEVQKLKDFEVIFVNDASTDNSLSILRRIQELNPFVKIVNLKNNSGSGYARNKGIEAASGEWILFMDADDEYFSDALEEIYSLTKKFPISLIYFNGLMIESKDQLTQQRIIYPISYPSFLSSSMERSEAVNNINISLNSVCLIAIKSEIIRNHNLTFKNTLATDWLFNLEILSLSLDFYFSNRPYYKYFIFSSENSLTSKSLNLNVHSKFFDYFNIIKEGNKLLQQLEYWNEIEKKAYIKNSQAVFHRLPLITEKDLLKQETKEYLKKYLNLLHQTFYHLPFSFKVFLISKVKYPYNEGLLEILKNPWNNQSVILYLDRIHIKDKKIKNTFLTKLILILKRILRKMANLIRNILK